MDKDFEISLKSLYENMGGDYEKNLRLKYGVIKFRTNGYDERYEFYSKGNKTKTPDCEDGEKAKLISVSDNEIVLQSEWTPDKTFSLTKEEFYHATPWALEKDKKELIGNKKFDELENDY